MNIAGNLSQQNTFFLVMIVVMVMAFCFYAIVVNRRISAMNKKLSNFCKGKNVQDLESSILEYFEKQDEIEEIVKKHREKIQTIADNVDMCYHKMTVYKYDAFAEMGGKLSFIFCMLNKNNDGFILNVVYSRDGSFSYIKTVSDGEADSKLMIEEEDVLMRTVEKD